MEFLDLVDKDGKSIGKTISRGETQLDGELAQVVHIWFKDKKNKFLIQKVSKEKGSVFAVTGGMVSSGETSADAAVREVKEEIGIDISNSDMRYIGKAVHAERLLIYTYLVQKDFSVEKFTLQPAEVDSIYWLSMAAIEKLGKELRQSTTVSLSLVKKYLNL
jgi:8-oxo-dGTP pyrophosphatase MutT (NUDIX family)